MIAAVANQARVAWHLATAERELRAVRDVSPTRAAIVAELHRYWTSVRYPRNSARPGRLAVFVDDFGARCAVAHLMATSGAEHIVARVAESANHARIADLASDRELVAWATTHELALEELARIQPTYDFGGLGSAREAFEHRLAQQAVVAAILVASGALSVAYSLAKKARRMSVVALYLGGAGSALALLTSVPPQYGYGLYWIPSLMAGLAVSAVAIFVRNRTQ